MGSRYWLDQHDGFFEWVSQYNRLLQKVEMAIGRMKTSMAVYGRTSCMELRDSFQVLLMCAQEGNFPQSFAFFSRQYDEYCRLLLTFPSC